MGRSGCSDSRRQDYRINRIPSANSVILTSCLHQRSLARSLPTSGSEVSPMAASLAYITHDPEPQLPLLRDVTPVDSQTPVQREVQANLQHEVDLVLQDIIHPNLREISQTILSEMLRYFD